MCGSAPATNEAASIAAGIAAQDDCKTGALPHRAGPAPGMAARGGSKNREVSRQAERGRQRRSRRANLQRTRRSPVHTAADPLNSMAFPERCLKERRGQNRICAVSTTAQTTTLKDLCHPETSNHPGTCTATKEAQARASLLDSQEQHPTQREVNNVCFDPSVYGRSSGVMRTECLATNWRVQRLMHTPGDAGPCTQPG